LSLQDGAAAPLVLHAAEPASDTDVTLYAALEQAWSSGDHAGFLAQGLPLARLLQRQAAAGARTLALDAQQVLLLSRCAQALAPAGDAEAGSAANWPRMAATARRSWNWDSAMRAWMRRAGAWPRAMAPPTSSGRALADAGRRTGPGRSVVRAVAHYTKPNFQRNGSKPIAAGTCCRPGTCPAQLECGMHAWRNRREGVNSDVRAAYWLLQAQAQGSREAEAALARIAPRGEPGDWGQCGAVHAGAPAPAGTESPLLAARLELARCSPVARRSVAARRACGRPGPLPGGRYPRHYGRSKRRLVLLRTARSAGARPSRLFERRQRRDGWKAITGSACTG
jgi:hypothetical protein